MLTQEAVQARVDARAPGDCVDLSGCDILDVAFGHGQNATPIEGFDFRRARLIRCSFIHTCWRDVKCQEARFEDCDMRYTDIERTSFKRASLNGCDLYRARLGPGTVFESADLNDSSLNLPQFDGVALPRRVIAAGDCPGLVQERAATFARYHAGLARMGRGDDPARIPLHLARRHLEAAAIYRSLSAHWASTGATRDAGWAYCRARRLETQAVRPDNVWRRRREERHQGNQEGRGQAEVTPPGLFLGTLRWLAGSLAQWVADYGESPLRVLATSVVVMLGFALLYYMTGVTGQPGDSLWLRFSDALLFSAQAMTASLNAEVPWRWLQWATTLEVTAGITLLGLLGFCLGNRLRNA
ncbi:pentapeptide repeat-containing protein [Litchfieldella xinjiangensis]|uniref:pentapeptide repeat-containing protein n=1 Tax=Litchfieldella xinjiangensis TaxID=1166948 RepID=UPI0005BC85C1|nr:pentapeptide repeat-containing protein [Halomonas xinjiangensis]